jgi:hypothetical protein
MNTVANRQGGQQNPGYGNGFEEPAIRVETTVYGTPSKGNPNEFEDFTVETKMWLPNGEVYTNSQPLQPNQQIPLPSNNNPQPVNTQRSILPNTATNTPPQNNTNPNTRPVSVRQVPIDPEQKSTRPNPEKPVVSKPASYKPNQSTAVSRKPDPEETKPNSRAPSQRNISQSPVPAAKTKKDSKDSKDGNKLSPSRRAPKDQKSTIPSPARSTKSANKSKADDKSVAADPPLSYQKPGTVSKPDPYYSPIKPVSRNFNQETRQIPNFENPAYYTSPERNTVVSSRVIDPRRERAVPQPQHVQSTLPQQNEGGQQPVVSIPGQNGYTYEFPTFDPHRVARLQHVEDAYQPLVA